jgi:hypothetical protein
MTEEAKEQESRWSDQVWDWRNTFVDRFLAFFPARTAVHLVNAQKEGILALRSLLDRGIDALDNDLKRTKNRH